MQLPWIMPLIVCLLTLSYTYFGGLFVSIITDQLQGYTGRNQHNALHLYWATPHHGLTNCGWLTQAQCCSSC